MLDNKSIDGSSNIATDKDWVSLPLRDIIPDPHQLRKLFHEEVIDSLADSIDKFGLLQPIIVRPLEHGQFMYMIVVGELRFRAHLKLGRRHIRATVKKLSQDQARDIQLSENVQRRDLSPIELAWEFSRRVGRGQTHQKIADVIGKSRTYVTQRLSLLQLSEADQERILRGQLNFTSARRLLSKRKPRKRARTSNQLIISSDESIDLDRNVTAVTLVATFSREMAFGDLRLWRKTRDESGQPKRKVSRLGAIRALTRDLKRAKNLYVNFEKAAQPHRKLNVRSQPTG